MEIPLIGINRRLLGVEIGPRTVRAVEVMARGKKIESVRIHSEPVPSEPVDAVPAQRLRSAVKALRKKIAGDTPLNEVVVSLPPNLLFHKFLSVPFRDRRRIEKVLPSELEAHLPLNLEEIVFDFALLGRSRTDGRVFVAGSKRQHVKGVIDLLKEEGLDPTRVQSSLVALGQVLEFGRAESPGRRGFIHLGEDHSSMGVMEGGVIGIGHSVWMGPNGAGAPAALIRNLRQFLSHDAAASTAPIDRFFVSGDPDRGDVLREPLMEELGIRIEPMSFVQAASAAEAARIPAREQQRAVVALGCALSALDTAPWARLNLRRGEMEYHRSATAWRSQWKIPIVLAAVLVGVLAVDGLTRFVMRAGRAGRIREQVRAEYVQLVPDAASVPAGKELVDFRSRLKAMETEASFLRGGGSSGPTALDVLTEISRLLPEEGDAAAEAGGGKAVVHAMKIEEEKGSLEGRADSFSDAERVQQALEKSTLLKHVKVPQTRALPKESGVQFIVTFEIGPSAGEAQE